MSLSREERKLVHQKSKQPTLGVGKPDNEEGYDGDVSFRQIEGSGTVQYVKQSNEWTAVGSSGAMPSQRPVGGTRVVVSGVTIAQSHGDLSGLGDDDHDQYLLIDGTRAMTSTMIIGADADGTDRSIVWGHTTLKTIIGIDDSTDAFVINTDDAFDATLANNSFSIDASHNVIIAGNLTIVGGDITLANGSTIDSSASAGTLLLTEDIVKSSASLQSTTTMIVGTDLTVTGGDIIYGNAQNATNTITATAHDTAGKLLTISAGHTTAGTTNNIAGGSLTFQGGQGKGSGAGGDIIFQTANAAGSGSSLNALATALTISDDLSSTFVGNVIVGSDGSGHDVTFHSATAGDSFFWDSSEEKLVITGTDGQFSFVVEDGNAQIKDKLYFFDNAYEYIDGNGTDLSINAGTAINLKANNIDIGKNTNADIKVEFLGDSNNGIFRWREDEDNFKFSDDILIEGTEKLYLNTTAAYLVAATAGLPSAHPKLHIAALATTAYTHTSPFTDAYYFRIDGVGQMMSIGDADYIANLSVITVHNLQDNGIYPYDTSFNDWA